MDGNKIMGILIIIALVASIVVVGYSSTHDINDDEKIIQSTILMDESDLNQSDESPISTINLNIDQNLGGTDIKFADNVSTIYNITSKNDENITTKVNSNQKDNQLDVDIDSDDVMTIVLSNKYNYTINGNIIAGGFSLDLNNNSHIDELNLNITAGGIDLKFNGGSLTTVNSKIATGGLNILGEPSGETTINSQIDVGGLNLQLNRAIAHIFSDIEIGGINPSDYQEINEHEYKGNQFDSSSNKLIINNNIKVGGINTQSF